MPSEITFTPPEKETPTQMPYPGVAVGVIIINDANGKVLLGKRKGELGAGEYSLPGGKVDFGEAPIDTAIREVKEETNLDIRNVMFTRNVTNDWFPEQGRHYVCLFYLGEAINPDDLKIMEPEKIESWSWFARSSFNKNSTKYLSEP